VSSYQPFYEHHLGKIRWGSKGQGKALCPFHNDKNPSLSVSREDGLWYCFACSIGGTAQRFAERRRVTPPSKRKGDPAAVYDYRDDKGLRYQIVRFPPKRFKARRPNPDGSWTWNVPKEERFLYNQHRLKEIETEFVFLPEGEKDCDTLTSWEYIAVTNPFGANGWRPTYAEALRGFNVVVLYDNDAPGKELRDKKRKDLEGIANRVVVLEIPGLQSSEDITDWKLKGHTRDEFHNLLVRQWNERRGDGNTSVQSASEIPRELRTPADDRLKIETLADLQQKDIPPRESFLGESGLIARGDLVIFSGPQKKGKSILSLNLALCLARGEQWLNLQVPKAIRVGIMQQEIPEAALKDRLQKMLGRGRRDSNFLNSIPHYSRQGLKLDTHQGKQFLHQWLENARIDLLIIDPLYTFHLADENRAKEMGPLFTFLQEIARHQRIAILIIHHHGKPGQVEREGGDLHRGTSLLRDVSDANWTFTKVPANKHALPEPAAKYVYLGFEQRHTHSPDPILLHMDETTLWFSPVEAKRVEEVRVEQIIDEINERGGEIFQEELIKSMKGTLNVSERSIRDALYKARDQGEIAASFKARKRTWKLTRRLDA
jgi:hypothetical protein